MRRTRAQILKEFDRLDGIFRFVVEHWMRPLFRDHPGTLDVPSRERCLRDLENAKVTPGDLVAGFRQALNDAALGLKDGKRRRDPAALAFLDRYRADRGRDFFADVGDPVKTVGIIARRGQIADETEFYLVREILGDADTPFPAATIDLLGRMLNTFEAETRTRQAR